MIENTDNSIVLDNPSSNRVYLIIGAKGNNPLFTDSFIGSNKIAPEDDPNYNEMIRRYKELAENSNDDESINSIRVYAQDPDSLQFFALDDLSFDPNNDEENNNEEDFD